MANDIQKKLGTVESYKNDRDGAVLITHPVIGIVKNNIDPTRNGVVWVYIENYGGIDPDDIKNWFPVKYMSPYFGSSSSGESQRGGENTGFGSYIKNPHSYGMWTGSPSIGSKVICIFINGRTEQGYYIGYVPDVGSHSMVPALGASSNVVPNESESKSYGGATRLPTTEVNLQNSSIKNSRTINTEPKPIHSYQASILSSQGLVRDNIRGVIGSSSTRESPSAVVGISTPGRPIYEGGYNSSTIQDAIKTGDRSKLKQIGSLGGHSFVMDDGALTGEDQLIRIRTSAGHQITMSDSGQSLFIIHSNGHSWIELGKEGTVDIYAANSFNVRTVGDINFHADRDINLHAKRNLNMYGESVKIDSDKNTMLYAGGNVATETVGKYSVKVGGTVSIESEGNSNYSSKGTNYIVGKPIHLNTGSGPAADSVPKASFRNHKDATYSEEVGWMQPAKEPLISITTRTPTHQPWDAANKGVDVEIKQTAGAADPEPTKEVQAANDSARETPRITTTPEAAQTVPAQPAVKAGSDTLMNASTVQAAVSQQAATNTTLSAAEKIAQGVVPGPAGLTLKQIEGTVTKPGTADFIADKIKVGVPLAEAMGKTLMTGAEGAKTAQQLVSNPMAQIKTVAGSLQESATGLIARGILTGKEMASKATGVVMAAASFGLTTVANVLKSPANAVLGAVTGGIQKVKAIGDMIAGGNAVAGMADKLMSGMKGVAALTGVAGLASKLQDVAKQAFKMVESSFGKLKAGLPNPLGGLKQARELSEAEKTVSKLNAAADEVSQAQFNLREMKRLARSSGDQDSNVEVQKAESALAQAKQKVAQLSSQITSGASNAETVAKSVESTGINSLPGGIGAFAAQIKSGVSNAIGNLKSAASNILDNLGKK
jgi:hypothetical protein